MMAMDQSGLNFRNLKEINNYVDKVKITINTQLQIRQYCKSACDLFQKAKGLWKAKDDENAYILFMRCFNTYQAIKKSYEFSKNKNVFNPLLKDIDPLECVDRAEKLHQILEARYEKKRKDLEVKRNIQNNKSIKLPDLDDLILPDVPDDNHTTSNNQQPNSINKPGINEQHDANSSPEEMQPKPKQPSKDFLSVTELYELFKSHKEDLNSILMMDIREPVDFNVAKIQHELIINIAPDLLLPNSTLNSVERYLSKETWGVWTTRFEKKFIIIVNDTFDEEQEAEELLEDKCIILQEILCKEEAEYKVLVLKGGIQKWVLHYPSMTINPEHIRKTKTVNQDENLDVSALLESLSYPTLVSSVSKQQKEEEVQPQPQLQLPLQPSESKNTVDKKPSETQPEDQLMKMRRMLSEESDDKTKTQVAPEKVVYPSLPNEDEKSTPKSSEIDQMKSLEKNIEPNKTELKPLVDKPKNDTKQTIKSNDSISVSQNKETMNTTNKQTGKLNTTSKQTDKLNTTVGLPYGWVKKVDQNSGKVYYIDHNTKTTHWVAPNIESNNDKNNPENHKQSKSVKPENVNQSSQVLHDSSRIPKAVLNTTPKAPTTPKVTTDVRVKPQNIPATQNRGPEPPRIPSVIPPTLQNGSVHNTNTTPVTPPQVSQNIPKQTPKSENIPQQPLNQPIAPQQPTKPVLKPQQTIVTPTPVKPANNTPQNVSQAPKNRAPPSSRVSIDSMDIPKQPSLKRSLSSPNLAENLANLNKNKSKTPIVDRGSKPSIPSSSTKPTHLIDRASKPMSASRLRNLSPVYGSQGMSLTGLKNLGNTCYMNSVLQCLVNTPPLVRYFSSGLYEKDLNDERINTNSLKGVIAREFAFIMKVLVSGTYRSVSPIDFKLALGGISQRFLTYEQQDSHEVLLIVLDGLHNDVNKAKTRSVIPKRDTNQLSDQEAADHEWKDNIINNDSLVFNIFQGQFRSTVTCLTCHYESKTFNTFNCLHLQLPVARAATLAQCLELFVKPEKIDSWHCERCKCDRSAAKKIELWKLPLVLIVQFKRFRCEGIWTNKVQTAVDYPVSNWNLSKYVTGPSKRISNYNLYGIINHSGSFESGHYTARCKNANARGGWFLYNDERVSELSSIKTKEAYVLLYTTVNFEEYVSNR